MEFYYRYRLLEGFLFISAIYIYIRVTKPIDRIGNYGFWGFIAVLLISYIANIISPPPPNIKAVAYAGFAQWLFIAWAYWIDRHQQI